MHITSALVFLSALAPAARAFTLTKPDVTKPVNLSEPVVFEWTVDQGENSAWAHIPWIDISLMSTSYEWGLTGARIDSKRNSSWTWDAPGFVEDAKALNQTLAAGENNFFLIKMYETQFANETGSPFKLETEKFEVQGFPDLKDVDSGVGATAPSIGLGVVLAVAAGLASRRF